MSDGNMRLTIVSPADSASFEVEVPGESTAADLVSELSRQGAAPVLPAGQSYVLALKGAHQLDEGSSITENGVIDGLTLQLIAPTLVC